MNTIEQQLWDYIDGNLDATQAKAIEEKINADAEIKIRYEELLNLNLAFEEMELDEPSMSFTRNVMESVALEPAPTTLKTKVNKNIIYTIGGFFVISLMAMFGYVLYKSNLQLSNFDLDLNVNFNWDKYITPTTVYCFLFADLVIGLVFLDHLMRKKTTHK
ncbi:hypothetical protein DU508_06765 [Pedobacter chinensis]|uniref:Zf-HC2 domain-containing protein n=1 Tax=Pedobacter chinensis TaxID=2282421 RepID=A0A369Q1S7_9SPHI|nr:hypothetical protein [Pedobacter chinensis]RDC56899.1 hypothetical protein DU508_06765 [Pedobacter chinensis]